MFCGLPRELQRRGPFQGTIARRFERLETAGPAASLALGLGPLRRRSRTKKASSVMEEALGVGGPQGHFVQRIIEMFAGVSIAGAGSAGVTDSGTTAGAAGDNGAHGSQSGTRIGTLRQTFVVTV